MITRTVCLTGSLLALSAIGAGARAQGSQERTVTLDQAVAEALKNQPAIIQASGNVDIAHASQREAVGNWLPTLSASSGYSQNSSSRFNPQTQTTVTGASSSYSAGLNASMTVFDGFARTAQNRSANASARSADASLVNQQFQIILQTKQAFFNALAAAELVKVSETQVARAQQQLRVSKDKLAVGTAVRSDTLQATVAVGNAKLQLLNGQAQQATAQASLARLMGADGTVHATGTPAMPDVAQLDTAAIREQIVSGAPSIQAADAQVRVAAAGVAVARAQYFPALTASYSRNWAGADVGALSPSWSARLGVSWSLFNGFTRESGVTRALVSRETAEATAADVRRQANAQYTQQLAALVAAQAQLTIAEASRAAAEEDLRVNQERYRLGVATIVDVMTSQVNLDQAEVNLVQARLNILLAKAQIEALIGREL